VSAVASSVPNAEAILTDEAYPPGARSALTSALERDRVHDLDNAMAIAALDCGRRVRER